MGNAEGIIISKLYSAIGGLVGGSTMLAFIRPKTITEAFVRGGVSVGTSIIFSVPLLRWMDLSPDWHSQLAAGFCVGFVAYSFLGMIANFFIKRKNQDIIETVGEIKDIAKK